MESTNVLVVGASGNTGIEICKVLNQNNVDYTALVRPGSESKLPNETESILFGSVMEKEEMKKVLGDVSKNKFSDVVIALGSRDLKGIPIRSEGTQNVIHALNHGYSEEELPTLHVISAHGVGDSWNLLSGMEKLIAKWLIGKTMKDHEIQEKAVLAYYGKHHIVRPVGLKDQPATHSIYAAELEKMPSSQIARADVAEYLVRSIQQKIFGIHSVSNQS
ncbi:MAG: SDR family oxidoreductase [Schleiferiaceae bacterium]